MPSSLVRKQKADNPRARNSETRTSHASVFATKLIYCPENLRAHASLSSAYECKYALLDVQMSDSRTAEELLEEQLPVMLQRTVREVHAQLSAPKYARNERAEHLYFFRNIKCENVKIVSCDI